MTLPPTARQLTAAGLDAGAPWTRQTAALPVDDAVDYVSDSGSEVWNVLEGRGIKNVLLCGGPRAAPRRAAPRFSAEGMRGAAGRGAHEHVRARPAVWPAAARWATPRPACVFNLEFTGLTQNLGQL